MGGPKEWRLFWSAPFGSSQANATVLTTRDPNTFTDLADALDFGKSVPNPGGGVGTGPAPTLKCFEAFARKSAKEFAGATYTGSFTVQAKVAKDSKGCGGEMPSRNPTRPVSSRSAYGGSGTAARGWAR